KLISHRVAVHRSGEIALEEFEKDFQVLEIAENYFVNVRILHLDRDAVATRQGRAMDLADRRGRNRLRFELAKNEARLVAQLAPDYVLDRGERHRRRVCLKLDQ